MRDINDPEFDAEVADGLVLVDFWAKWCAPCKLLTPVLEKLAQEYPSAKFLKLDIDTNPGKTTEFGLKSVPTVQIWRDGKLVESIVGVKPAEYYEQLLKA